MNLFSFKICANFLGAVCICCFCSSQTTAAECDIVFENVTLKSGDVVLFASNSWRARLLRMIDSDSVYAHAGLVDICSNGIYVIEADPDRNVVAKDLMSDYIRSNSVVGIAVLRLDATAESSAIAMEFARRQVSSKTPFDHQFRYCVGEGLYCTELVLRAWETAGIRLLPEVKVGARVSPSELQKSKLLHKVAEWGDSKKGYTQQ